MLTIEDIKRHEDGIFYVRKYLGHDALSGRPMRPYKRFPEAASAEEALAAAQEWYATISAATELHVTQSLSELLEIYIRALEVANVSPNTIKTYRSLAKCYVDGYIGDEDPNSIMPYMIEGLYGILMVHGARGGDGISPNTVIKLHWFLRGAWKWFVAKSITPYNPMLSVKKPSEDAHEALAYNEEEHARIQEAIYRALAEPAKTEEEIFLKNAMFAAHLALNTGARCGEICAFIRQDVHIERQMLHICANAIEADGAVRRRTKTKGRRMRNVAVDEGLCDDIRRHYAWQDSYLPRGMRRGKRTPVCTTASGQMMRPSKVSAAFSTMRDALGLPKDTSFHTLRHTHATWLLIDGEDMRSIQERLGHADTATTLKIYSHILPGRDRVAADRFGARRAMLGGQ